jgi:hypothetical protein
LIDNPQPAVSFCLSWMPTKLRATFRLRPLGQTIHFAAEFRF